MGESVTGVSVGMNGGFEQSASGVQVNWIVYSPSPIPIGDYDLLFDDIEFKEGRQSLNFLILECSRECGWHSPGICQEYPAQAGESYEISFWLKSDSCSYTVRVGSVDAWNDQWVRCTAS